jgi:hypothetical protein
MQKLIKYNYETRKTKTFNTEKIIQFEYSLFYIVCIINLSLHGANSDLNSFGVIFYH